ncbi:hypothetical protein [Weissella cibaria]|nr:hypothetical protein [Weissella cibaria]
MNKTVKNLIDKVKEATQEIDQIGRDIDLAILIIDEQHKRRTRRDDR